MTDKAQAQAAPAPDESGRSKDAMATQILSGGFFVLFVIAALIDLDWLNNAVNTAFGWSATAFGAYWQVLLLATFIIGLVMAFSRLGRVRVGASEPDRTTFTWIAMIMCTLLAGGGVFWAAAEPIAHFTSPPPLFDVEAGSEAAASVALAQAFMHWGFLAWAILGAVSGVMLMHLHYHRELPIKPRTLLYPVFGDRVMGPPWGPIIDALCVIAVAAGTIGPIGFLGLQVAYGVEELFGIPGGLTTQIVIVLGLMAIYVISAITGLRKGIQILSRFNVVLALGLAAFILVFGPTGFIVDNFIQAGGRYLDDFIPMATFRGDTGWLGWWTVFFWGWFLGYGPLMAMFVARISRGRTIREVIVALSLIAPLATAFWFTIVGGSGIAFDLQNPGSVADPYNEGGLPAAMLAVTQQFPLGGLISILFLILTTIFVATTGDSMSYTISLTVSEGDQPATSLRVFWGIALGAVAIILLAASGGGDAAVGALQSFIVVTAVPVSLILLPTLWYSPKLALKMADGEEPAVDNSTAKLKPAE